MKKWLINVEDVEEEVEFETIEDAIQYVLDNTNIRESDAANEELEND